METKWIKANEIGREEYKKAIAESASLIKNGDLVAFPTETVYGLGGNAFDEKAAEKIYKAKGRPSDNPLIVHISYIDMLEELVSEIPSVCRRLAFEFWPGPLTMILPKSEKIPKATTGGLDTVAVRMPANGIALDLIDAAGLPIAAPSANLSGKPSTTHGSHVYHDLQGRIPMLLDGGEVEIGVESTILDLTLPEPVILRPGKLTYADLKPFVPWLKEHRRSSMGEKEIPKAPGMKYTHYAPEGAMSLIPQGEEGLDYLKKQTWQKKTAVILSKGYYNKVAGEINPDMVLILGEEGDFDAIAHNLFHAFRQCDEKGMKRIYIETFQNQGFGEALMNRISKAVSEK